ncbi:MAG: nuclear transport factor 2 family protein [Pseudomonadota bacterium]
MDRALQHLIDVQAIKELVHRYCRAVDRRDYETLRKLYHSDAVDDHGSFFKGLASEFIDQLPDIQAPMSILHHNVTTVNVELDGDYAEGEVYVLAFHQVATDDQPLDLIIGGRYLDKYERRQGQWKYGERAVLADWATVNHPSAVQIDHPMLHGSKIGRPGPDDPAYKFFRLFRHTAR